MYTADIHHDLKFRHHHFYTIRFSTSLVNSLVSQMSSSNCDIGSMIVITVFILYHDFDIGASTLHFNILKSMKYIIKHNANNLMDSYAFYLS